MKWYERLLSLAGGLLLIYPGVVTDAIGFGIFVVIAIMQVFTSKKEVKAAKA